MSFRKKVEKMGWKEFVQNETQRMWLDMVILYSGYTLNFLFLTLRLQT